MIAVFFALVTLSHARPRVVVGLRAPIHSVSEFAPLTIEGFWVTAQAFETLARINAKTGEVEPWLATGWRRSARGLSVDLRPNVPTALGRTLTPADVVESLGAFRDPRNHAATWLPLWQKVSSARVSGPLTFEFLGELDHDDLTSVLTTLRVRPATGPFALTARGGVVDARPRTRWWHGPPPDFDLRFKAVADETLARQLVRKGELDFYADVDGAGTRVTGARGIWIDFNLRRPLFRDREVRRALLRLWDRAGLNRVLFGGEWSPAADVFDPRAPAYPPGKYEEFDPVAGLSALKAAGYRDVDGRLVKKGDPLAFEILVTSARDERWVSLLQRDLARVGVGVTIKRVAADPALFARLREGNFDAIAGAGGLSRHVERATWATGAPYNVSGLSDHGVDDRLARLAREFDSNRRLKIERELIARLRTHFAQLPGLSRDFTTDLLSPKLKINVEYPDDVWRWRKED